MGGLGAPLIGLGRRGGLGAARQRFLANQATRQGAGEIAPLARPMVDRLGGRGTAAGRVGQYATAAAEAVPGVGLFPLFRRASNARRVNMSLARGLGFDDWRRGATELGDVIEDGFPRLGRRFDDMADALNTPDVDQLALRGVKEAAVENGLVTDNRLGRQLMESDRLTGRQIMAMRSDLGRLIRGNADQQVKLQVQSAIDEIDDIIEQALSPDQVDNFRDARARWRLWVASRDAITPDGQVSIGRLNQALKRVYGDRYRTGNIDDLGVPDEVADALRYAREGAGYEAQMLQSSGTAERLQYTTLGTAAGVGALNEFGQ